MILEISELNKNEIIKACEICLDAKADYIKTSSGFSKSGATLTAIKIIKKTIRDATKIVASGDIEDYETAIKYLEAGADVIGTSVNITSGNRVHKIEMPKFTGSIWKPIKKNWKLIKKKVFLKPINHLLN